MMRHERHSKRQPRKPIGLPTAGQFDYKERADAEGTLGATHGTADLGVMFFHEGNPPRTETERAMVRADRFASRVKERADQLHERAILERIQAAYPDVAALQLDVGQDPDDAGMVLVRALNASGEDVDAGQVSKDIEAFLASEHDHIDRWREEAEFSSSSMSSGPAVVDIATELERLPVVPETGSVDAAAARAEDMLGDYHAVYGDGEDEETSVRDMLADLYHLCEERGWDFDSLAVRAAESARDEARDWAITQADG